jgi:AAA domain
VKAAKVTLHFGRKGSGKSYAAKRLAERAGQPVAVWDTRREWAGRLAVDPPKVKRAAVVEWRAFLERQRTAKGWVAELVAFQLPPECFDAWARWVTRTGNCMAIVDEAQLVMPAQGSEVSKSALELVTCCRHVNVDLVLCCQRPKTLSPNVRAQADAVRSWAMREKLDLDWIREYCGDGMASKLPTLGKRKSLSWGD